MGFENDKLGRKDYANILTGIIENPEKYKRNSDSDSFTMAIDSSWGTGKTEFLKMWEDELKLQKNEKGNNKYIVIRYNSWENDFAEDPLQSIIYTILSDEIFDKQNDKANGKEALKEAFGTVINLAEESKIPGIKILTTGAKGIKQVAETMFQETSMEDKIKEFKDYRSKIGAIKEKLEDITKDTKIILLIDELDRCKPLFAIKLLETIKHIFNVKNMAFVFALDMTQLSYSVKKVYGSEIDAAGYICRFFDYITKMPNPDTKKYIEYLMEKKPLIRKAPYFREKSFYGTFAESNNTFVNILQELVRKYQLSLRDINTIYSNFTILEERELKDVDHRNAYGLYLFLLMLKYKNLDLFHKIFISHNIALHNEPYLLRMQKSATFDINVIQEISENKKIHQILENNRINIIQVNTKDKIYKTKQDRYIQQENYDHQTNLLNCIFYPEIENYENIKQMGIADYIHKKLELFNFEWEQKQEAEE
ncbi:MAG: hypothetical protein J6A04_03620 [Clostridia bacterium]|nr:hypothetical protein [Clostridia bacterium]